MIRALRSARRANAVGLSLSCLVLLVTASIIGNTVSAPATLFVADSCVCGLFAVALAIGTVVRRYQLQREREALRVTQYQAAKLVLLAGEAETVSVTFSWTRHEYFYFWRGGAQRWRMAWMIAVVLYLALQASLNRAARPDFWVLDGAMFVMLAMLWMMPHFMWHTKEVHNPVTVIAGAAGVIREQGVTTRTQTWRELSQVRETNELFVLRGRRWWAGSARLAVTVPKRAFASPQDLDAFRRLLPTQR